MKQTDLLPDPTISQLTDEDLSEALSQELMKPETQTYGKLVTASGLQPVPTKGKPTHSYKILYEYIRRHTKLQKP